MNTQKPGEIVVIPLSKIVDNPFQPRQHYNEEKLKELAASIREHGQRTPIEVRKAGDVFQTVAGHRRRRANKIAGLDTAEAIVREVTDEEMASIALVENLQREDLSALDEADGYANLRDRFKKSVPEIAKMVSQSASHVYAMLKLASLRDAGRKALTEGKIQAETAIAIARIPVEKLQTKVTKEVIDGRDGPMSVRDALAHIQRNYMLLIADAPFDATKKDYLAKEQYLEFGSGPSCKECPLATANMDKSVTGDVQKGQNLCTHPVCFQAKKDAQWAITKTEAKAKGIEVVPDSKAKDLFPYPGNPEHLADDSGLVSLDGSMYVDGSQKKISALLGKHAPAYKLARDPAGGVHKIAEKTEVMKALKAAGITKESAESPAEKREKTLAKKEREEKRERKTEIPVILAAVAAAAEKKDPGLGLLLHVIRTATYTQATPVALRRGLVKDGEAHRSVEVLAKAAEKMNAPQMRGVIAELLIADQADAYINGAKGAEDTIDDIAKMVDVSVGKLLRDHAAEEERKAKEEEAKREAEKEKAKKAAPGKGAKGPLARKQKSKKSAA